MSGGNSVTCDFLFCLEGLEAIKGGVVRVFYGNDCLEPFANPESLPTLFKAESMYHRR
jgi:hypothetical protein